MNGKTVLRVLLTVAAALLIGFLGWIANGTISSNSQIGILNVELKSIKERLERFDENISEKTVDRYKKANAKEDFAEVHETIKNLDERIRYLEKLR